MGTRGLEPWGRSLSGTVKWQGEEPEDCGEITVVDGHRVQYRTGRRTLGEWRPA